MFLSISDQFNAFLLKNNYLFPKKKKKNLTDHKIMNSSINIHIKMLT